MNSGARILRPLPAFGSGLGNVTHPACQISWRDHARGALPRAGSCSRPPTASSHVYAAALSAVSCLDRRGVTAFTFARLRAPVQFRGKIGALRPSPQRVGDVAGPSASYTGPASAETGSLPPNGQAVLDTTYKRADVKLRTAKSCSI